MTDRLQYWQRGRLIFGAELAGREKLVLLAISDHLGSNASAWPSHARLAKRCGMAKRTVVRSLEWLETHEVITVQRLPGGNNRYQISTAWLKAHQCQSDTSVRESLVSESHYPSVTESLPQCQSDTTPVSQSHPKEIKKEIKKGITKETKPARKTKPSKTSKLTLPQVKAVPIPDGLPDGYPAAFQRWIDVRSGDHWRKAASQTEAFHAKMLRAHQQRKDVLRALERAHENGWSGIKAGWMDDLPIQVSVDPDKPRRALKSRAELLAAYRKTLEIS